MATLPQAILPPDTLTNRPAAGSAGRLFYATDTQLLYRDTGTGWDSLLMSGGGAPAQHDHTGSSDGGVLTNDKHDGYSEFLQIATPSTPPSNSIRVYAKDKSGTATLYYTDEAGTEYELPTIVTGGGGTGSGAPADAPYVTIGAVSALASETPFATLILHDTEAHRPAAGVAGRLYYSTDTVSGHRLYRDNGSTWDLLPVQWTDMIAEKPTLDTITAPAADVSLNSHKITSLATPTASTDAATKAYVDGATGAPASASYVTTASEAGLSAESTLASVIGRGASGSRPSAGTAGRLYYNTTTSTLQRDNGSTWDDVGEVAGGSSLTIAEADGAPSGTPTTLKFPNGTLTDNGDGSYTYTPAGGGGGAPTTATYITEDADGTLSAEVLTSTLLATGAHGSRPAAAKAARLYLPNDGVSIARDTGSAYKTWGPIYPLTPPPVVSGNLTWLNQGGATATETLDSILLTVPAASGNNVRGLYQTAPATPYTLTACILPLFQSVNNNSIGLFFRESSSGKLAAWVLTLDGASPTKPCLLAGKYTSATAYSATYQITYPIAWGPCPLWLRIADNGTNRICSWSPNGIDWLDFHTVGRTDFLTADQIGFHGEAANASVGPAGRLISWVVG